MPIFRTEGDAVPDPGDAWLPRSAVAAAGALLGGIAAMSCCVLPLVFVFAGVSGAWIAHLTALSPYQPAFVGFALAAIGYGHFMRYRARMACTAGEACAAPLPGRLVDAGLWTGTDFVAAALMVNYALPLLLT